MVEGFPPGIDGIKPGSISRLEGVGVAHPSAEGWATQRKFNCLECDEAPACRQDILRRRSGPGGAPLGRFGVRIYLDERLPAQGFLTSTTSCCTGEVAEGPDSDIKASISERTPNSCR